MKDKEQFDRLRQQKIKFSLRSRMTLLVGTVLLGSMLAAYGLASLLHLVWPAIDYVPFFVQVIVYALVVALIAARWWSRIFFEPIQELRGGMKRVADGDFQTHLQTKSSSAEIRELFAGFNMMTQELSTTEILQTDFVSNVSHEFKTPINAIEGYSTLLQGCENLDADQQEYVDKILFNTRRLSSLVGNILLLSKIENQTIQTHQTTFRLDEQIRQSILALEPAWTEKEIEFDVEMDRIDYQGNESLLRHVWDNLIGNAVKFNRDKGLVRIRLYRQGERIVFTVEDTGPGLSEEAQKHLFDKFYQGDSSHKQEGNGLGLALVKRIVAIAGGEITAQNGAEGCCFTVEL